MTGNSFSPYATRSHNDQISIFIKIDRDVFVNFSDFMCRLLRKLYHCGVSIFKIFHLHLPAFSESRQRRVCHGYLKAQVFDHPVNFAGGVSGRREIAVDEQ